MSTPGRDLAAHDLWERSLERSRRRRTLAVEARREVGRRKGISAAMATAMLASTGAPLAVAGTAGAARQEIAAASPTNRAIELKEGGLPLKLGDEGELVAHVQRALGVSTDGVFGAETDAAVRRYQYAAKLAVDGIVGPLTWSSLFGAGNGHASSVGGDVTQGVKNALAETLRSQAARASTANSAPTLRTVVDREGLGDDSTAGSPDAAGSAPSVDGSSDAPASAGAPDSSGALDPSGGSELPAGGGQDTAPRAQAPTQRRTLGGTNVGGDCSSASLASPVKGVQTSPYGMRWGRMHEGVDIAAPSGTPVRAAACGTVSVRGQQSGYGNMVCITHTASFATCYAHLSGFAVGSGQQVKTGQTIGYVGCTGSCTGPHLHFETRVGGQAQDPRRYLGGATIPGKASTAEVDAVGGGTKRASRAVARQVQRTNASWSGGKTTTAGGATLDPKRAAATPIPATVQAALAPEQAPAPAPVEPVPAAPAPAPTAAPTPTEVAPTAPTAAPAPTDTAPVETAAPATTPAPVDPAPAEVAPAPVEAVPVPSAPAPVETTPAPTATAPVETAPTAPPPTASAPVETAPPATAPAETSTTEAAPVEAAPAAPQQSAASPGTEAAPAPAVE